MSLFEFHIINDVTSVDVKEKKNSFIKWAAVSLIGAAAMTGTILTLRGTEGPVKEVVQDTEAVAETAALFWTSVKAVDYIDHKRVHTEEEEDNSIKLRQLDDLYERGQYQ